MKLRSIDYLPAFLLKDFFYSGVLKVLEEELSDLLKEVDGLKEERIPATSTKLLSRWEAFLDIPIHEDKPIEYRRSVIVSKLRSSGTLTLQRFKEIAMSFENGDVELTENHDQHQMKVKFVSERGMPPNYDDFKTVVEEVKPAHVEVIYEFTYNTRDYLKKFSRENLKHFTKEGLRTANITEVLATIIGGE